MHIIFNLEIKHKEIFLLFASLEKRQQLCISEKIYNEKKFAFSEGNYYLNKHIT